MQQSLCERIELYAEHHTDEVSPLLKELLQETMELTARQRWSIGKVEGIFLQMLVKLAGARRVVEIGTFTGYSAILIAEALPEDGQLITCEMDRNVAEVAERYFNRTPHGRKIRLEIGPALDILLHLTEGEYDFVFIDADKPSYCDYFDQAMRLLRPGGVIFVDNVFWKGKVLKNKTTNPNARAIKRFNAKVREDDRVEKVMLAIRDGCYLIRKK
ncbi:MAG: class I SAM-dependent methyltransferase [Desulfobacterales bacterium]